MNAEKMKAALESIRKTAMEHPEFVANCFESRNIDELCEIGGDACTWTIVAIEADDALKEAEQTKR